MARSKPRTAQEEGRVVVVNRCGTCGGGCTGTHCDDCEDAIVLLRSSDVAMRVATTMLAREGLAGVLEDPDRSGLEPCRI